MAQSNLDLTFVKDVVRRHWAEHAAGFDAGPTHGLLSDAQRVAWSSHLRGWAGAEPLDVLDVGCRTGFLALQLAAEGHRVTGIDVADEMLALAREKADRDGTTVRFQSADAERLPFNDASFDLLVERHVIWTLPDPSSALREWRRVLRPKGRLLLIEGQWGQGRNLNDAYADIRKALPLYGGRPASDLRALLMAAGFIDIVIEPLTEATLWGAPPESDRYALIGHCG